MKKALSLIALIAGIWLLVPGRQSKSQQQQPHEVKIVVVSPSESSRSIGATREPSSFSRGIVTDVLIEKKYTSDAEEAFYHPQGIRLSESYRVRLYEDVHLTPNEAYSLNKNEEAANEEIYQLGIIIEKIKDPTQEDWLRFYLMPRAEIYKRLEQTQIELLGASRYQILQDGKEKYADDRESQFGTRPSTDGW